MEKLLDTIKEFADKAHGDQKRKYSKDRYIVHPLRVMLVCREYCSDNNILAAALLHDVLEDTPVSKDEMKAFLLENMAPEDAITTLNYVIELTDVFTKGDYPSLNRKARKAREIDRLEKISKDAQTIKYADILDNCQEIVEHDVQFAPVFLSECKEIIKRLNKGDEQLRERAMQTVNESLQKTRGRK